MPNSGPPWVRQQQNIITVENVPVAPEESAEDVVDTYGSYSGSSDTAQDLFNRTVPADRKGILDEVELSADNYSVAMFYIAVKGVVVLNWEKIPESFTKKWPGLQVKAGQQVLVQVKSNGANTINAYCDVSYKEVG